MQKSLTNWLSSDTLKLKQWREIMEEIYKMEKNDVLFEIESGPNPTKMEEMDFLSNSLRNL